jgi:hypothetical protein
MWEQETFIMGVIIHVVGSYSDAVGLSHYLFGDGVDIYFPHNDLFE